MKTAAALAALALGLPALAQTPAAQTPAAQTPAAQAPRPAGCPAVTSADIERQFERFNAAWATGNPDEVVALFAPDATLLATVSNAERNTPELIRAYFVDFLRAQPVGSIETSTVSIDCTLAKRSGNWTVAMTNDAGERVNVPARYSFVYGWDGRDWKIRHLHSSVRPPVNPS